MDARTLIPRSSTISVVVDEGSRFCIARVVSSGEGNQATWEDMKKIVEENWFSIFGIPKSHEG